MDYDDEYQVNTVCEFAVRGGVLDVYSPAEKYPARIEFFGDEIESIRYFSSETQKTVSKAKDYSIIPRMPFNESETGCSVLDYFNFPPLVIIVFPSECEANLIAQSSDFERIIDKFQKA